MAWESTVVRLACGCEGRGAWDTTFPEDSQQCKTHGKTTVHRVSRIYENDNRTRYQFGAVES